MLEALWAEAGATSRMEGAAAALALAYLVLAVRESVWCWPCAIASTALYMVVFHDVNLFMESLLNAYYLAMAVVGWVHWRRRAGADGGPAPVVQYTWPRHVLAIAVIALLVVVVGAQLERTAQDYPYLDTFTTVSALWATWLTARKVLENWYYWLVIDTLSIGLYLAKGLVLTAALFVVYIVLVVFGWRRWRRSLLAQRQPA